MNADPAHALAALIGAAAATADVDRDALLDVARRVVGGGDAARERLGCLVATAIVQALEQGPTDNGTTRAP